MELRWYFEALAAVIAGAWWVTQVETGKPWAVWIFDQFTRTWETVWTMMMRHLGPDSPYTYQSRHGAKA